MAQLREGSLARFMSAYSEELDSEFAVGGSPCGRRRCAFLVVVSA